MDWKEFFRFNKLKIIILVIIIVLTLISLVGRMTAPICERGPCPAGPIASISEPILKALTAPVLLINILDSVIYFRGLDFILSISAIILTLIYQYILSCFLVYSYKNYKTSTRLKILWVSIILLLLVVYGAAIISPQLSPKCDSGRCAPDIYSESLSTAPSADDALTIMRNINIKFKGEQQVQIGYYNKNPDTKYNVEPYIKSCKTASGNNVSKESLPILALIAVNKVEPGGTAGWNAIIRLPDISVEEGALTLGQYICQIGVYGTSDIATQPDFEKDTPLESDQFFIKVQPN